MVQVLIEAAKDSALRRRFDETTLRETTSKRLRSKHPFAYGFIIGTNTAKEDALDCFVISDTRAAPGDIVECEIENGFVFREDDEIDIKMLGRRADDHQEHDYARCHELISRFLGEVFLDWPHVRVTVEGLFGKATAEEILKARRRAG